MSREQRFKMGQKSVSGLEGTPGPGIYNRKQPSRDLRAVGRPVMVPLKATNATNVRNGQTGTERVSKQVSPLRNNSQSPLHAPEVRKVDPNTAVADQQSIDIGLYLTTQQARKSPAKPSATFVSKVPRDFQK